MVSQLVPVQRVVAPVRAQLVQQLRQAIVNLDLPAGHRLVERELSEQTGASRPSIREALRQLESEKLVVSVANRGTFVAAISRHEAAELYQVRAALEGMAARLFVENASEQQVHGLRRAAEAIAKATRRRDRKVLLDAKAVFYDVLLAGAGNATARQMLASLHARVTALRATSLSQPGRPAEMVEEVMAMVAAVERRDAAAAVSACVHHVVQAAQYALASLPTVELDAG